MQIDDVFFQAWLTHDYAQGYSNLVTVRFARRLAADTRGLRGHAILGVDAPQHHKLAMR